MSFRLNENFNNSIPFLLGYKHLKIPIIDSAGNPAWPEMFSLDKIRDLERIVGPRHFSAQMMLEYVSEEKAYLDPGALKFYEDDFDSLAKLTKKIGDKVMLVGDDYFVTNEKYLEKGIKMKAGNAILLKANQIGTMTEMLRTIVIAKQNNYKTICILSHVKV